VPAGSFFLVKRDVIVCSFYTPDDYYATHASELNEQLSSLGIATELLEIHKKPGEDWADTTRRKIGFIRDVCHRHPEKMVFWIDVDCRITHLPEYISNSTADLIGFQRSFGNPLQIGYHNRTRFWEPSFWGVNATPQGRKLVEDAYQLEQRATLKATDDYFLEEAWRGNARNLTFQLIPSSAVIRNGKLVEPDSKDAFFVFGSSGNVADFRDKVVQHGAGKRQSPRRLLLKRAKQLEKALPDSIRQPLRRIADGIGITDVLTQGRLRTIDPERSRLLGQIMGGSMKGDGRLFQESLATFEKKFVPSHGELSIIQSAQAFISYSGRASSKRVRLAWWAKPFPGNFGDWLSPLILSHFTDAKIVLQPPVKPTTTKHIFALGSIGRFIKSKSVVLGTGISSDDVALNRKARYISVRGPLTAAVVKRSGGPEVTAFGDTGLLLSKVIPAKRGVTNGKIGFVRHFSQISANLQLPVNFQELSVLMSRREDIEQFVQKLVEFDAVVTSAMHVMITCQSYGIPCALVTFEGHEENVHGSGMKYEDYALGAEVEVVNPAVVPLNMKTYDFSKIIRPISVSEAKKDEVEAHIKKALAEVLH
jgi:hypothetical protein